jgi:hypothetical protein
MMKVSSGVSSSERIVPSLVGIHHDGVTSTVRFDQQRLIASRDERVSDTCVRRHDIDVAPGNNADCEDQPRSKQHDDRG